MKAEINLDNKERFFALYWSQDVLCSEMYGDGGTIYSVTMKTDSVKDKWLLLKPLSKISDEDAVEVAKIVFPRINDWKFADRQQGDVWIDDNEDQDLGIVFTEGLFEINGYEFNIADEFERIIKATDYLRSSSYALPWMGISVEEQMQHGWIKLEQ